MNKPKQKLYKTAYSLVHECYVALTHAFTDIDGRWIYHCENASMWDGSVLHREEELTNFVL